MESERATRLREKIRLYEEKRQEALYKQPYDNAIEIYKEELEKCQ